VPQLDERPELWPWNFGRWRAFTHLSKSRRAGFASMLPVPMSEIAAYRREVYPDFDVEDRLEFLDLIGRMDHEFLRLSEELSPTRSDGDDRGAGK
jgi:hypothetical protein